MKRSIVAELENWLKKRITGAQMKAYKAFAATDKTLTWEAVSMIETNALIKGGIEQGAARATVTEAKNNLKQSGVTAPKKIPWAVSNNIMTQEEIAQFAKLLVRHVRDAAIKSTDVQLHANNMNSPIAKRWRNKKKSGNIDQFAEEIIADCVDNTIFYFLLAIDEGLFKTSFTSSNGKEIPLTDIIGELGGWYMGEWRSEYSEERCSNDLDDI